jgi:hypothetical protein
MDARCWPGAGPPEGARPGGGAGDAHVVGAVGVGGVGVVTHYIVKRELKEAVAILATGYLVTVLLMVGLAALAS